MRVVEILSVCSSLHWQVVRVDGIADTTAYGICIAEKKKKKEKKPTLKRLKVFCSMNVLCVKQPQILLKQQFNQTPYWYC